MLGAGSYVVGRVDFACIPSRVRWPTNVVAQSGVRTCLFGWDGGWGMCFYDGVHPRRDIERRQRHDSIDTASVPAFASAARNDVAVWGGWDGTNRQYAVKVYSAGAGTQSLTAVDRGDVTAVALSDERMVWTGVHGPLIGQATYESAEIIRLQWRLRQMTATFEPLRLPRAGQYFAQGYPTAAGSSFDYDCDGAEEEGSGSQPSPELRGDFRSAPLRRNEAFDPMPARQGANLDPYCGSNFVRTCTKTFRSRDVRLDGGPVARPVLSLPLTTARRSRHC